MTGTYVHGYDDREHDRLNDQAGTLVELLHGDTAYPAGSVVLEAGCGVGAQTVTLAARSPAAHLVSIDVSGESITQARRRVDEAGLTNVELRHADIFDLPFPDATFDHLFVCFVLEHLARRRRVHPPDVHGDDRGDSRRRDRWRPDRPRALRRRRWRPPSNDRGRRGVLLHLFQGRRLQGRRHQVNRRRISSK